jgi:hypothetical protein
MNLSKHLYSETSSNSFHLHGYIPLHLECKSPAMNIKIGLGLPLKCILLNLANIVSLKINSHWCITLKMSQLWLIE